ncbi:MAG TPA: NADH-quinone oxidoreductase subunit NuoK [Planctomycetota bacterium]|nr:NADH-quinone oxidoreductase subunit NuoK [Planctomycetota bacterium]
MDLPYPIADGPDALINYLVVAAILFACGVFALISRRNAVGILIGVELILNAAALNFIAFSRFGHHTQNGAHLDGQVFTLFIIVLAAAEAAVALALVLAVYQAHRTIALDSVNVMKS